MLPFLQEQEQWWWEHPQQNLHKQQEIVLPLQNPNPFSDSPFPRLSHSNASESFHHSLLLLLQCLRPSLFHGRGRRLQLGHGGIAPSSAAQGGGALELQQHYQNQALRCQSSRSPGPIWLPSSSHRRHSQFYAQTPELFQKSRRELGPR